MYPALAFFAGNRFHVRKHLREGGVSLFYRDRADLIPKIQAQTPSAGTGEAGCVWAVSEQTM